MKTLLVTGKSSSCGKTTVTCALLAALVRRGYDVGAFKCGPDYIDPMFHRAMGVNSYNLDPYFLDRDALRAHFAAHARQINIIEGVMGFYDGIAGTREGSTAVVAQWLQAPVIYADGLLPYEERLAIPSRRLGLATDFTKTVSTEAFAEAGERIFENCDCEGRRVLLSLLGEPRAIRTARL
jgi:cobyrinic acid a,c-diamide synthase